MRSPDAAPRFTWQGWTAANVGGSSSVTSARLPAQARVQNRMFPKTRSWLALGAPLELLSPLSVLRIIYALAMVLWAVEGLALRWPHAAVLWHLGATIVAAAVWVALLLVKDLTPLACRLLIALGSLLALMQVYLGHSIGPVLASALFLLPLAMFVALYLGGRAIVVYQLLVAGGLWLALVGNLGTGSTTVVVVAGGLAMLSASLTVHVLTRSVSRSGSVDPDTGLPNGIGLAQRISSGRASGRSPAGFVVAAVYLAGVDDARQALGYRVGAELFRRAVEDLGQIVPAATTISRVEGDELVVTHDLAVELAGDLPAQARPRPGGCAGNRTPAGAGSRCHDQLGALPGRSRRSVASRPCGSRVRPLGRDRRRRARSAGFPRRPAGRRFRARRHRLGR
ncbi:MAG: hypothetical protein WB592_06585 [Acidimicrobiales bacterium]